MQPVDAKRYLLGMPVAGEKQTLLEVRRLSTGSKQVALRFLLMLCPRPRSPAGNPIAPATENAELALRDPDELAMHGLATT